MQTRRISFSTVVLSLAVTTVSWVPSAWGQQSVPWLRPLLLSPAGSNEVGSPLTLSAFGYNPVNDDLLAVSFYDANQTLRRFSNLDAVSPTVQEMVRSGEWTTWMRGGTAQSGGLQSPQGILANRSTVGQLAAGAAAWIVDSAAVVNTGTTRPELTKRIYRYNYNASGGDASSVFTSVATLRDFQLAAGSTNTTLNLSRQPAFSGDGKSLYVLSSDPSTTYGGLWRVNIDPAVSTNRLTRLAVINGQDANTEVAVLRSGTTDSVYLRGIAATNPGGIDRYTVADGATAASARETVVTGAAINTFLELPAGSAITTFSMAADAAGNLYFNDAASSTRRGIFRLDPQGRMSKVLSYRERQIVFGPIGNPNVNTLRMQFRTTAAVPTAYTKSTIDQLLYVESSPINAIAAINLFEPGDLDFRGDNRTQSGQYVFSETDRKLFIDAIRLTAPPTQGTAAEVAYLAADLNGSGTVTSHDLGVLRSFYTTIGTTPANGLVNFTDLDRLAERWMLAVSTATPGFVGGDWDGDGFVGQTDLSQLVDVWGRVLRFDGLSTGQLAGRGYSDDFVRAAGIAFAPYVPEPSGALMLLGLAVPLSARARRR